MQYWQPISNDFKLAISHWMGLAYLMLKDFAEIFDTTAETFLQK